MCYFATSCRLPISLVLVGFFIRTKPRTHSIGAALPTNRGAVGYKTFTNIHEIRQPARPLRSNF